MTLLPLALLLSLGATPPAPPCQGERLVLMPFDRIAVSRPEARRSEEAIRRVLARTSGLCLESRAETLERLRVQETKRDACTEDACRAAQVKALGAMWLLRGRVLELGGERTVSLVLVGPEGRESGSTFLVPTLDVGVEEAAKTAFGSLWQEVHRSREPKKAEMRPWPFVVMGAGAAALVAGAGFGLMARATEKRLSTNPSAGCSGEGEVFRHCIANELRKGQRQTSITNGLLITGGVLGAGGVVYFVWETP